MRKENRILTIIDSEGQVIKVPQNAESKEHLRQCNENERRLLQRGVKCLSSIFDGERIVSRFFNGQMANLVFGKAICQGDRQSAFAMLEKLMLSLKKSSDYTNVSECNPGSEGASWLGNRVRCASSWLYRHDILQFILVEGEAGFL